jgi:DNA-binding PadR family transcriptional regulator
MRRRLDILTILYPNTIMSKTELAEKSGISDEGNLSRYLNKLEENGLVSTHRLKAKDNKRRMVNLSDLSSEVLTSFLKREKTLSPPKALTDESYLVSTLGLLKETDQEIRQIAVRELVDITRTYIIPPNNEFLLYMETGLAGEADSCFITPTGGSQ